MQSQPALSQCLALIALVIAPAWASAQEVAPTSLDFTFNNNQVLDELQIVGKRLYQMKTQAADLEDKIYALYNDLNQDDEFDIHCKVEPPTGSRLNNRVCRVAVYEQAKVEEARGFLTGDSVPPAELVALSHYADYQKHTLSLINSNPQLLHLVRARMALENKYWQIYKANCKRTIEAARWRRYCD